MARYAMSTSTSLTPEAAVERVTALLAEQGFGILTRIDVHAVLEKKLGISRAPYIILGACNPTFAHAALEAEPEVGILLPCNVAIEAVESGTRIHVTEPEALFSLVDSSALKPIMVQVRARLEAVALALAEKT